MAMLALSACGNNEIATLENEETLLTEKNEIDVDEAQGVLDESDTQTEEKWAKIPMVMVEGQLYYATGKESTVEARCGVMDGEIISSVDGSETPTENNQSNFGSGYGYQYGVEGTIEVQMEDGKWYVYEAEQENIETEEAPASIRVENPSWDYYTAESVVSGTKPYTLQLVEESANEIIDTEEWRAEHELYYDPKDVEGNRLALIESGGTLVNIFEDGTCIAGLDFTDYMYAPDLVEADKEYVDETVHDAKIVNGILYVSIFHYTYAASAPSNAYIVAISLEDYSVIWKSKPLVCNSLNFEIVDDIIFCGYGFTAEADYLYQLDCITGCVLDKTELKSKPDYIIHVDNTLYVRTYNTDYEFEILK